MSFDVLFCCYKKSHCLYARANVNLHGAQNSCKRTGNLRLAIIFISRKDLAVCLCLFDQNRQNINASLKCEIFLRKEEVIVRESWRWGMEGGVKRLKTNIPELSVYHLRSDCSYFKILLSQEFSKTVPTNHSDEPAEPHGLCMSFILSMVLDADTCHVYS